MSWPLYMDQHVPWPVTAGLRQRGVDVLTAQEDHRSELDDAVLLSHATDLHRLLFTQDRDFLSIAAEWLATNRRFFGIVFCPQQRLSHGELIDWLELVVSLLREEEIWDQVIYLPIR